MTAIIQIHTLTSRQYKGNTSVTEIKLSNSIQIIPRECFQDCPNLKRIVIPRSVTRIDFKAFANSGLEEVIFETDSSLRVLSARCFESCSFLTTLCIPLSTRTIGYSSFRGCKRLKNKISVSAKEIGAFAFSGCGFGHLDVCLSSQYKASTNIKKESQVVLNIGYGAFEKCHELQHVNIYPGIQLTSSVISTENHSINHTTSVPTLASPPTSTSTSTLTSMLTQCHQVDINQRAFSYCIKLVSVHIMSSMKRMGRSVFAYSSIEELIFAEDCQLEHLPDNMSLECNNLKVIKLPSSVRSIGNFSFSRCFSLKSITIPSSVKIIGISAFQQSYIEEIIFLQCSQLQVILKNTFSGCDSLRTIDLPSSLQVIGEGAISNCFDLLSITIPSSVKIIGKSAFKNSNLEKVIFALNSQVRYILDETFSSCCNLQTIVLPSSLKSIGRRVFFVCSSLASITIPSSVESMGESVFADSGIEEILFSHDSPLQTIPDFAFARCRSLQSIALPPCVKSIGISSFAWSRIDILLFNNIITNCKNIESIGNYAFTNCDNLTQTISIISSVESIGCGAFAGSHIEEIIFPQDSQIQGIPDTIFENCHSLRTCKPSPSMKSIGMNAFARSGIDTKSIDDIFEIATIQHIGEGAFAECENLKVITIPPSVISIGEGAFALSKIEKVTFSRDSQLQFISNYLFSQCYGLKVVSLPSTIMSIGISSFLESGINSESIHNIFANCNIQDIGDYAFSKCPNLQLITIPSSIKSIGVGVFDEFIIEA